DPEPERTLRKLLKAARLAKEITQEVTLTERMGDDNPPPPRRTMGDYCRRTARIRFL
ncbi:hypothetical protein A2U01_0118461, partial [Trifolium medium]|nr:hypothetical protein [Trifolium medium]